MAETMVDIPMVETTTAIPPPPLLLVARTPNLDPRNSTRRQATQQPERGTRVCAYCNQGASVARLQDIKERSR